jgi:hypothetical protein
VIKPCLWIVTLTIWIALLAGLVPSVTGLMAQTLPITGTQVETRFVPTRDYRGIVSWYVEFDEVDEAVPAPNPTLLRQQISGLEVWAANASGERRALYLSILADLREDLTEAETTIVRH